MPDDWKNSLNGMIKNIGSIPMPTINLPKELTQPMPPLKPLENPVILELEKMQEQNEKQNKLIEAQGKEITEIKKSHKHDGLKNFILAIVSALVGAGAAELIHSLIN